MAFKPNKYQQAVYDFCLNGQGNAVISAVAGSGKSTTIVNALNVIPAQKSKVFLAFNKAIVEELQKKVTAPNTKVQTLHSAGFGAMMRTYSSRLDAQKYIRYFNENVYTISEEMTVDSSDADLVVFKKNVCKLIDLARAGLLRTREEITQCAVDHDIDLIGDEDNVVIRLMNWGVNQVKKIDYCDMIWITVMKNLKVQTYDWVMIDECQDLSPMQNKLFQMMIEPRNGRFIAVGDRQQSIQYFAGAGNDSFDNIATLPNTIELPLSICYRCPKLVIEKAKEFVPTIEAFEGNSDGIVEYVDDMNMIRPGDMVLSRVTSALVCCCMNFIKEGIPSYIKGRDMGESLKNYINRSKKKGITPFFDFMDAEYDKLYKKLKKKKDAAYDDIEKHPQIIRFKDKIETMRFISEGCKDTTDMLLKIDTLFKDSENGICFSTIHKSKGLEANNVFIIELDKFPLEAAMRNPIQAEQERNLQYVAITRAKKSLYFVNGKSYNIKVDRDIVLGNNENINK